MRGLSVLMLCIFVAAAAHAFMGEREALSGDAAHLTECGRLEDEIAYRYTFIFNNLKSLSPDFAAAKEQMEALRLSNAAAKEALLALSTEQVPEMQKAGFESARRNYLLAAERMEQMAREAAECFEAGAVNAAASARLADERRAYIQRLAEAKQASGRMRAD